jgi:hypothetical protein
MGCIIVRNTVHVACPSIKQNKPFDNVEVTAKRQIEEVRAWMNLGHGFDRERATCLVL